MRAVDGVSLDIRRGEVLGLVGESGSGKTTLGRTLLGLVRATGGSVEFEGREITRPAGAELPRAAAADAGRLPGSARFAQPGDDDRPGGRPSAPDSRARARSRASCGPRVADVLERVGLAPAEQYLDKYPSDLSGGQKQRAVIARAIILNPVLLVADEPVSMLDMSVRAKILELMLALKRDFELTYLYITHDLATARFFCDRIAIMYLGRIVEIGPARGDLRRSRSTRTRRRCCERSRSRIRRGPCRATCRGARCRTRRRRRSAVRSIRAARARSSRAAGSRATCATCSSPAGRAWRVSRAWRRSRRSSAISTGSTVRRRRSGCRRRVGGSREEVVALLERIRAEDPEEPFWRGVERLEASGAHVALDFQPAARAAARAGRRRGRRLPSLRLRPRARRRRAAVRRIASRPSGATRNFRRRSAQERVHEQRARRGRALPARRCGREPRFDLERCAAAGRQRTVPPPPGRRRRRKPARSQDRRPGTSTQHSSRSHPFEPLQLAAGPLERGDAIAEPARVLESSCLRQLPQSTAAAGEAPTRAGRARPGRAPAPRAAQCGESAAGPTGEGRVEATTESPRCRSHTCRSGRETRALPGGRSSRIRRSSSSAASSSEPVTRHSIRSAAASAASTAGR